MPLPTTLPDVTFALYSEILGEVAGTTPDYAFRVFLQALQGLGSTGILYSESQQTVTFSSGAATVDASIINNILTMTLTENSAITINNGTTIPWKPFTLVITHTGGPHTLSWAGTDLELTGAAGEREYLLVMYNDVATKYDVFHGGVVDVII